MTRPWDIAVGTVIFAVLSLNSLGCGALAASGVAFGERAPSVVVSARVSPKSGGLKIDLRGYVPTRCWTHRMTHVSVNEQQRRVNIEPIKERTSSTWCPPGLQSFQDSLSIDLPKGSWRISFEGFAPAVLASVP